MYTPDPKQDDRVLRTMYIEELTEAAIAKLVGRYPITATTIPKRRPNLEPKYSVM